MELTGGDEFLTNVTRLPQQGGPGPGQEPHLERAEGVRGLGDLARHKVNADPRGNTELHLSAYKRRYALSFVHTSTVRKTKADLEPLKALMAAVLARLD